MTMPPADLPKLPLHAENVGWVEWKERSGFNLRYRHLTSAAVGENYHVGFAIEELAAGSQSAPAHYHMLEEEHVYVLAGELTLRLGNERQVMKAGDYVCFPAGQRAAHCLINHTNEPCRYIIVGERNPNDVIVYPDSNKVMVRPLGRDEIYDLAGKRGYWDGEVADSKK